MKRFSSFLLTALLCLSLVGAVSASNTVVNAHKTTYKIVMSSLLGDGGSCSATAIGPHALLTASHCVAISSVLNVNHEDFEVKAVISDGLDHSIYLLDGPFEFLSYATVDLKADPKQGDHMFLFGNPGGFSDMYREGYIAGYDRPDPDELAFDMSNILSGKAPKEKKHTSDDVVVKTYYDFNGYFGDSGSGIFDEHGHLIAVTSFIDGRSNNGYSIKFMGGFEFHFTQKQLDEAREFNPKK